MKWFIKPKYTIVKTQAKMEPDTTQSQWVRCTCGSVLYAKDLEANHKVCTTCGNHFRLSLTERIEHLTEPGSFKAFNEGITSADPLEFIDGSGGYVQKIKKAVEKTKTNEAVTTGYAMIGSHKVTLSVMNFDFLGGSMGSAVGEKIYRAIMKSYEESIPCLIISCSGGARMHEGILSLMQMAKTSAGLAKLAEKSVPFLSILTDPTTGGVTASFAMLGDVNIAEPGALIGFAGPRVIEQNIRQKLPEGFQRSEFVKEHGFLDMIVDRRQMKETIVKILDFFVN
ncbi:MAG: acetyl-CoA carboxylase carboxyltransferase subunit beta [Spirochaetes bacterium]|nr:acetyl-CoA carboxylase carboxyltransferase subunit beta [Spirochaetota bacterium]